LTKEKTALENELRGKGDKDQQHADEIAKLTETIQQKEQQLNDKITECDNKINEFEQQMKAKDDEITKVKQEHDETRNNVQNQTQTLQQQIDQLKEENNNLIQRIMDATQTINDAAKQLEDFSMDVAKARNEQELNQMLSEVEQSIELISRAIQGQPVRTIPENAEVQLIDGATGQPMVMLYGDLIKGLKRKIEQVKRTNPNAVGKYVNALQNIIKATSVNDIPAFLIDIPIKNTDRGLQVTGGRRSKKNRKQKGGFTYKATSKRRSILSAPKTSRTSSRNSRTSR
jgi:chromosome segregation ATPase